MLYFTFPHVHACYRSSNFLLILQVLLVLFLVFPHGSQAEPLAADLVDDGQQIDLHQEKYTKLFEELKTEYHFTQPELNSIFEGQSINKRVLELMDRQWEAKPYYQYLPLFLTPLNIARGKEKLVEYKEILDRVEKEIGVDREVVVAIWGIETRYGENQGSFPVLQTLNTLFDAYPRRSEFFRKQLIHFLVLCRDNDVDPKTINGSYAGAFGQTQFIPSSFRSYAVSFDGDEKRDVWNSVPDILASIANYLKQFNWTLDGPLFAELGTELKDQRLIAASLKGRQGKIDWQIVRDFQKPDIPPPPGNGKLTIVGLELPPDANGKEKMRYVAGYPNFQAITEWNHSNRYAMAVSELSLALLHD